MTPDGFTFYGGRQPRRGKAQQGAQPHRGRPAGQAHQRGRPCGHHGPPDERSGRHRLCRGVLRICKICDVPAVIAVRRDATLAGSLINASSRQGRRTTSSTPRALCPSFPRERSVSSWIHTSWVWWRAARYWKNAARWPSSTTTARASALSRRPTSLPRAYASSASELVTEFLQYVATGTTSPTGHRGRGTALRHHAGHPVTSPSTPACAPSRPLRPPPLRRGDGARASAL